MSRSKGADTDAPAVTFRQNGAARRVACDFVAGCDGFHGVSRRTIPKAVRTEYRTGLPVRLARRAVGNPAGE
jgi:p-hydroxybenzoate 3-monooxygenase